MIRRAVHFALAMVGAALWIVIAVQATLLTWLAVLGRWIWPEADKGNCWTEVLPKLARERGGLVITLDRLRIWKISIPHAAWVRGAVEDVTETEPIERHRRPVDAWFGLRTLYFRFRVDHHERRPVSRR